MRLARLFGRAFLSLAGLAFLVGVSLFLFGSYLLTWPMLRLPPRERRMQAAVQLGSAVMGAMMAFRPPGAPGAEIVHDQEEEPAQ